MSLLLLFLAFFNVFPYFSYPLLMNNIKPQPTNMVMYLLHVLYGSSSSMTPLLFIKHEIYYGIWKLLIIQNTHFSLPISENNVPV